jgi:phenylalanyl-tRNA synthetase beta subunit
MLWSVTYRAGDRTLTDDEVNQAHQRLRSALRRELGVVER